MTRRSISAGAGSPNSDRVTAVARFHRNESSRFGNYRGDLCRGASASLVAPALCIPNADITSAGAARAAAIAERRKTMTVPGDRGFRADVLRRLACFVV